MELPSWEKVCIELGICLHLIPIKSEVLGLFINNPEAHQPVIFINTPQREEGSQNYTVAHEIAHYLLHYDKYVIECDEKAVYFPHNTEQKEIEANEFAAELLMPTPIFRKNFCKGNFDYKNVMQISDTFKVSKEASARRRVELDTKRDLAFVVVIDGEILSLVSSVINEEGVRWLGRKTVKNKAVTKNEATSLEKNSERRLCKYFLEVDRDNNYLNNLIVNIYSFYEKDGYYLFIERMKG